MGCGVALSEILFRRSEPVIQRRGVHFDLKGFPPSFSRLLEWVKLAAQLRFNVILVEWEDMFPWQFDPRLRSESCYTEAEVREFAEVCRQHGIEIVPLVQSLGHAENVLSKSGYEDLREVGHRSDVFHPLHPESPKVIQKMVAEVLELLPETRWFHLGGDEAYTLGKHPASQTFIQEHGMAQLYMRQLRPVLQDLKERGIRPVLWHDEVVRWSREDLRVLAPDMDLMVWGYSGDPRDAETYHHRLPHAERLQDAGFPLWAATAFKGASGANSYYPKTEVLQKATCGWVALDETFSWEGVVATGWSRYASGRIQTEPFDVALDALINTAVILHEGDAVADKAQRKQWMEQQGLKEHFQVCFKIAEELTVRMEKVWTFIRHSEEQLANLLVEPARAGSGIEEILLEVLTSEMVEIEKLFQQWGKLLEGRIAPPWFARYHQTHVLPVYAAIERLKK